MRDSLIWVIVCSFLILGVAIVMSVKREWRPTDATKSSQRMRGLWRLWRTRLALVGLLAVSFATAALVTWKWGKSSPARASQPMIHIAPPVQG